MTFEEWQRETFSPYILDAPACRDAWNAAAKAEREKCAKLFEYDDTGIDEQTAMNWRNPVAAIRAMED